MKKDLFKMKNLEEDKIEAKLNRLIEMLQRNRK